MSSLSEWRLSNVGSMMAGAINCQVHAVGDEVRGTTPVGLRKPVID